MAFLYRLEMADGASAEPPTFATAVNKMAVKARPIGASLPAMQPSSESPSLSFADWFSQRCCAPSISSHLRYS